VRSRANGSCWPSIMAARGSVPSPSTRSSSIWPRSGPTSISERPRSAERARLFQAGALLGPGGRWAEPGSGGMLPGRMLPVVAVQISPRDPAPVLEERLLSACSAGLKRARCVAANSLSASESGEPRAIAVVSWDDAAHVSIEVGLGSEQPIWLQRDLQFLDGDPDLERWRAAGFTVALLVDDPRFWSEPPPAAQPQDAAPPAVPVPGAPPTPWLEADLKALSGSGLVAGAWRLGAEARLRVPFSAALFATGSARYALAREGELDVRWFDASLGLGWCAPRFWSNLEPRVRLEGLAENLAVTAERAVLTERRSAWIPGVSLGADLIWPVSPSWALSASIDGFWLDGSTVITNGGERVATSAGAGILLGLGAGVRF